jgi:hypothetical protein
MAQANVTSLVLIALAVILGGSLLAVAVIPVYASHGAPHFKPAPGTGGCDEDKTNPATHNPHCLPVSSK